MGAFKHAVLCVLYIIKLSSMLPRATAQSDWDLRGVDCRWTSATSDGVADHCCTLEVYLGGAWGTVCSDGFNADDAYVACKKIGCAFKTSDTNHMQTHSRYIANFGFSASIYQPIWLANVDCGFSAGLTTQELYSNAPDSFEDCTFEYKNFDQNYRAGCESHTNDVGICCFTVLSDCSYCGEEPSFCTESPSPPPPPDSGGGAGENWPPAPSSEKPTPTWTVGDLRMMNCETVQNWETSDGVAATCCRLDKHGYNEFRTVCNGEELIDCHWGSICPDGFSTKDAVEACKQLGCPQSGRFVDNWAMFDLSRGDIGCGANGVGICCATNTDNGIGTCPDADGCVLCPAGKESCDGTGQCGLCALNKMKPYSGWTPCMDQCMPGQQLVNCLGDIQPTDNRGTQGCECVACPAGKYKDTYGSSDCLWCYGSSYSSEGATTCTYCPAGKGSDYYQPTSEQKTSDSICKDCVPGKYGYGWGSQCESCPSGTYSYTSAATQCKQCLYPYYQDQGAANTCKYCSPSCSNGFSTTPNSCGGASSGSCECVEGNYVSGSSCLPCAEGKFSNSKNVAACTDCANGFYTVDTGNTACQSCGCPEGQAYAQGLACGGTSAGTCCLTCGQGKYSTGCTADSPGQCNDCPSCTDGQYRKDCAGHSFGSCKDCTGPEGTDCGAGRYLDECSGVSAGTCKDCQPCIAGKYRTNCGGTSAGGCDACTSCDPGFYNEGCDESPPGSCVQCETCEPNQYMLIGSSSADECGGIFPGECQTCASCPAGVYREGCGQHSAGSCTECAAGTYKESQGSEACIDCECGAGTYMLENTGATSCSCVECAGCEAGTYRAECGGVSEGQCTACPAGKFKTDDSSNPCTATCGNCSTGFYREGCGGYEEGTCTRCEGCPDDQYRQGCTGISAGSCTTCPGCDPGTYRIDCYNQSIGSCAACAPGKYKSTFGSEACKDCSCSLALQYFIEPCGGTESGRCAFCEAGKYLDKTQEACVGCSAGTYSFLGASECRVCSNGKYSLAEATACLYCEAGKFAMSNASACAHCDAGTFALAGRSACSACPAGRYSAAAASTCTVCEAGTYASKASVACTECAAGTYSGRGSASCFSCPAGTYSDDARSTECIACPFNTFSTQEAATSADVCVSCADGLFASQGASSCSACGAGSRIEARDGLEICQVCALGGMQASASRFQEACPVTCNDNACVKAFVREANSTRNVTMREHIAAVYGTQPEIELALQAMEGTWEHTQLVHPGTQLVARVVEVYHGHECGSCAALLDPKTNQPVPLGAYSVAGAEGSCTPTCDAAMHYYKRGNASQHCVLCDTQCGAGEYLTGENCDSCFACQQPVEGNWHWTGPGRLDDSTSCPWSCDAGYFLDYVLATSTADTRVRETCIQHTAVTCDGGQYQVRGTNISDAYCEECQVSCEGRNQTAACSAFADAACTDCLPLLATLEQGAVYILSNCTRACHPGYVMNRASGRCEFCAQECGAGFFAPADRANCTDCHRCTDTLPTNASYVDACTWACDEGFSFAQGSCVSMEIEPMQRRQSQTQCARGERLVWQATVFACEACDVPLPAAPVDSTWRWLPSRSSCAWECLPGYYRAPISATLVDCLAWEAYQMQILGGPAPASAEEPEAESVSATTINNIEQIEFRREEREYATLSIAEFGVLAGFVFGTLLMLMLTQT